MRERVESVPEIGSEDLPVSEAVGEPWQPWARRMEELEKIDARLTVSSASQAGRDSAPALEKSLEVQLRYARAMLLAQLGRQEEALAEHLNVVRLEQTHQHNLNALGLQMAARGHRKAALLSLAEAVKHHPQSVTSRVNFGAVLLAGRDAESAAAARQQFEAALHVDPNMPRRTQACSIRSADWERSRRQSGTNAWALSVKVRLPILTTANSSRLLFCCWSRLPAATRPLRG